MFIFNRKCITTELDHGGMLSFTAREQRRGHRCERQALVGGIAVFEFRDLKLPMNDQSKVQYDRGVEYSLLH